MANVDGCKACGKDYLLYLVMKKQELIMARRRKEEAFNKTWSCLHFYKATDYYKSVIERGRPLIYLVHHF